MPKRTFIHNMAKSMPGFKDFKDRVTVFLGGNVLGYKPKRFVIWHCENPLPSSISHASALQKPQEVMDDPLLLQDALLNCY